MHSGSLDASLDWYRTIHCPKQLFVAAIFTVMVQSCAEHYGFWCTNNKHLLKAGLYFPFSTEDAKCMTSLDHGPPLSADTITVCQYGKMYDSSHGNDPS